MSKLAISGNASGTGVFTVASPNSNVDRVLTLPDESGTVDTLQRSGNVIQVVNFQTGALATGTTITPNDNTIPQITEGDQYMSLAITPTSADNILIINVSCHIASTSGSNITTHLHVGTTADALSAAHVIISDNWTICTTFSHSLVAGVTTELTFRVRAGGTLAGTRTFNGAGGLARMGGKMASSITITEYTA